MSVNFQAIGILSSVVFIIGDIPYILDTFKGKTKPHRVTWGIVFLLNAIGFLNQYASGARNSLWLFGAATLVTGVIFFSSFRFGVGGKSRLDIFAVVFSLLGVCFWIVLKEPFISIVANLLVGTICFLPAYKKAWLDPGSETLSAYAFGSVSSALAAVSVGVLQLDLLLVFIVSTVLQIIMVAILLARRRTQVVLEKATS